MRCQLALREPIYFAAGLEGPLERPDTEAKGGGGCVSTVRRHGWKRAGTWPVCGLGSTVCCKCLKVDQQAPPITTVFQEQGVASDGSGQGCGAMTWGVGPFIGLDTTCPGCFVRPGTPSRKSEQEKERFQNLVGGKRRAGVLEWANSEVRCITRVPGS